jgi:LPXTG-motif cell wall-anchored protein
LLAVLLVSTLVLATAAPLALAQAIAGDDQATAGKATAGDDRNDDNANITIVDCSQVHNAFVQGQYGNANASAQYDSDAVAVVAQELDISQDQVNSCLVNVGGDGDGNGDGDGDGNGDGDGDGDGDGTGDGDGDGDGDGNGDGDAADTDDEGDVIAETIPETDELPETGGSSLLALGAGVALVAGAAFLIRSRR